MAPVTYKIDPKADTVIILKSACIRFAPWRTKETSQDDVLESWSLLNATRKVVQDNSGQTQTETVQLTPENDNPEVTESLFGGNLGTDTTHCDTPSVFAEPVQDDIHYHVSSRHLILASSVFRNMLQDGRFEESRRNENDGLYHVAAQDWDAEAFLIVLQIVHGRNKQVPRKIPLELLAKIAVIEDYYVFGEALDMFKDLWFQNIEQTGVPTTHCRDLVLWIWATWVFNVEEQFEQATLVAIKHGKDVIPTLGLPLSPRIMDNLEHKRYFAIQNIFIGLNKLLEGYESSSYTCPYDASQSFPCGSFLLGALTKGMNEVKILHPPPTIPFSELSFEELCTRLKQIKSPPWISWTFHTKHRCSLEDAMATLITNALATIEGLHLASLKCIVVHSLEA